jgi:hypothetical protein
MTMSPALQDFPAIVLCKRMEPARIAESRLRGSAYPELHLICCDYHEGVLTLNGKVSSFYAFQMAQALATRVPGVEVVVNRIEVKRWRHARCPPVVAWESVDSRFG